MAQAVDHLGHSFSVVTSAPPVGMETVVLEADAELAARFVRGEQTGSLLDAEGADGPVERERPECLIPRLEKTIQKSRSCMIVRSVTTENEEALEVIGRDGSRADERCELSNFIR